MKAVEFKNVSFSYKDSKDVVLKNIDFFVNYGEVALLSGFSGEGKSTIFSLISGIIPNVIFGNITGEILIDGSSILNNKISDICRKVGVVLQNADLQIIHKTVDDEVAFGCENFAFTPNKIDSQVNIVCNLMNLETNWKTRTLSGGQKQRLITASSFATGQKILILDEPLANLDIEGADFLMNTLKKLSESGYAILVIEHRLDMVLPYVDSVWNIENGKVTRIENKKEYLTSQSVTIIDNADKHNSTQKIFTLKNVSYIVKEDNKERTILKDISFYINKGEKILLLGENGCGKTTLLRLIARLNKLNSGTIEQSINPKLGERASKKWFKDVGIVYQNPNYQLFMPTVQKEIEFGAVSKEYAQEMIKLFQIDHLKDRHPQSLSEGQKRRVTIASVAASKPKVLLLDEPTVGQDYKGLQSLVEILNSLHNQTGNTMITITHDMRCAEALCDRAVIIENGVISKIGDKELVHDYFFNKSEVK